MEPDALFVFLLVWLLVGAVSSESRNSAFRFGAVLSTLKNEETDTTTMVEAKNGYEVVIDEQNKRNGGRGFFVQGKSNTTGFYFSYKFMWKEDESKAETHYEQLHSLISDKVHFIGGSHPGYAAEEMRIANASGIMNYQCCVGPDHLYEKGYRTVFGVPASNREYSKMTIRTLYLQKVRGIGIYYDASNPFTRTTCEAAVQYTQEAEEVQEIKDKRGNVVRTFFKPNVTDDFYAEIASEARKLKLEAVVACVFPDEGKKLVDAFHNIKYPLKAFFLTTGPTKQSWIDSFEPAYRANNLLSSAQWHRDMRYSDDFFNNTARYTEAYEAKYTIEPTYNAAAASAVVLTLTKAIKNAFKYCDISKTKGDVDVLLYDPTSIQCDDNLGDKGYDRILRALRTIDMETFFGRVKFNYYQRNVGLDPVTTQVREADKNGRHKIEAVLPLGYATAILKYPADNPYKENCIPGYFMGDNSFDPCEECSPGEASHTINARHCDSCPIGEWNNLKGQSKCTQCPEGTITEVRGAKSKSECKCASGYFNVAGQAGIACEKCPVGAECEGGTAPPVSKSGYWKSEMHVADIYECDPQSVCKGGPNSTCKTGYEGRVIQVCHLCLNSSVIVTLFLLLLMGWYIINVTVSKRVGSLEMILGWAQLANIIGDVNLNWTEMVRSMFGVANLLDFDVDILEPSCLISWGYKQNFITQLLLPFVMSLMAFVGYLGSTAAYYMLRNNWIRSDGKRSGLLSLFVVVVQNEAQLQQKWDTTIATFLSSVDVTYVTIAKYCMDVFKCENIAGESVLAEDPSVLCGTTEHTWLIVLASFGLVFYVVGYPTYVVSQICYIRNKRTFDEEVNLRRFGFVYEKYELDYYFTPIIVIIRKLLFVSILVYMNNPAFQVGALAIIITASLIIHVYTAPYVDTYLDVLFNFLLIALMFEAFGGLMFYSVNLPKDNRRILNWIVLGTMMLMVVVFLAIFILDMIDRYHVLYVKRCHRRFCRRGWRQFGLARVLKIPSAIRSGRSNASFNSEASNGRASKYDVEACHELLDTFRPSYISRMLKERPEFIEEWDKLTHLLKDYVSDQSVTSYLSMDSKAKFWRKLVDRFPEIVDFLAVADAETRAKFNDVVMELYHNFYLMKKVTPLPLMKILNWRDYAPMAQWLAIASTEERDFFVNTIAEVFRTNGSPEVAEMLECRVEHGGRDPTLTRRLSSGRQTQRIKRIISTIENQPNPFYHPAADKSSESSIADGKKYRDREVVPEDDAEMLEPNTPRPSEISLHTLTDNAGASSSSGSQELCDNSQTLDGHVDATRRSAERQSSTGSRNKSVCFVLGNGSLDT